MFDFLIKCKEIVINWWYREEENPIVDGWSLHNEFMMGEFFENFRKSGQTRDLVLDLTAHLDAINQMDCPFEKEKSLNNLSTALNILIGK